jgi:choline-sulfatase
MAGNLGRAVRSIPFAMCRLLALLLSTALPVLAAKPNVLFLFADDQCYNTVRALGHLDIDTPNLDRLVAGGTTFTHAYNMGSFSPAVCVASRTMLATGRSLWQARAVYDTADREREAGRLWPQLMAAQGYATYYTGKWHVKADATRAYEFVAHLRAGMPKDVKEGYNRPLAGQPDPWSPSDPKFGGFWEGGQHWSEVVGDDAIAFLEKAAADPRPFFLTAAFNAPHDPRQSPKEYVDRYPLERVAVPANFLPEYPHKDAIGCGPGLRDEKLGPFPRTEHAVKVHRQEYHALITHMDTQVGRILDALERSGRAENTYVFFTADHGLALGQHGLFGKQNLYEHSLRVPLLVRGPGIPANARVSAPVHLQDVMPTALELAGAPKPPHVFFHSLLPLARGETKASAYPSIYAAYLDLQRAILHDGWKLMVYPKAGVLRLYHLTEDPLEQRDLAADPAHAERRRALFARLRERQRQLGDPFDLSAAFPGL